MKKLTSLLIVSILILSIIFSGNVHAVSLDTINVGVDKTIIRPGENVKLTITFGENLGAYTFKVAYDKNLFEYVSVDGGTANPAGEKLIVEFHDAAGGSSPRSNAVINFKAKSGITTSNPTEFVVTGEGLANADGSVEYDDITEGKVKEVTVEPEYVNYELKLEHTGEIVKGVEKEMKLSYASPMGKYYEKARLVAEATTPEGASVKLIGVNAGEQTEQDIIQSGWGDTQGYRIGGANVAQVLNLKALFSNSGDYKITLKLIDRANSDTVIASKEVNFSVLEKASEKPATNNTTGQVATNKPKKLPKTGENIYVPSIILTFTLIGYILYYNKKDRK